MLTNLNFLVLSIFILSHDQLNIGLTPVHAFWQLCSNKDVGEYETIRLDMLRQLPFLTLNCPSPVRQYKPPNRGKKMTKPSVDIEKTSQV